MQRFATGALLIMILSALAALPAGIPARAAAAELPVIELGLPDDGVFGLGGHYLIDKGLDRKNGFIIKPRWAGVAEVVRLLADGAIPMGLAASESTVRANLRGIHIRLIQPYLTPHNAVVVRKESPYRSIMDLKNKSFAVPPEVTSAYSNFDYIMRKQGVHIEKFFQLKKLGGAGIVAALSKGEVEAGYSSGAFISRLVATGDFRVLMTPRDEMNRLLHTKVKMFGWVGALEPWVDQNPAMIPKLRRAWQETIAGVQEDEANFRKYAKSLFDLEKPGELELGWKRTRQFLLPPDFPWPDKANLEVEKRYLKEAMEFGILPKKGMVLLDKIFVP